MYNEAKAHFFIAQGILPLPAINGDVTDVPIELRLHFGASGNPNYCQAVLFVRGPQPGLESYRQGVGLSGPLTAGTLHLSDSGLATVAMDLDPGQNTAKACLDFVYNGQRHQGVETKLSLHNPTANPAF